MCLYGVAGIGKTTLAKESSAIYGAMQRPQPRSVPLLLHVKVFYNLHNQNLQTFMNFIGITHLIKTVKQGES